MSHEDYPKGFCPLTGKVCAKFKPVQVTEIQGENTVSFSLCQECSVAWGQNLSEHPYTPIVKPNLSLDSLPEAIKEITDAVFGKPKGLQNIPPPPPQPLPKLPEITISHNITITPQLLREAADRVAKNKAASLTCPGCKSTLEDMSKSDRLGCPQCYETFKKHLDPLLMGYHGATSHKGKEPKHKEEHELRSLFSEDEVTEYKIASLLEEQKEAIKKEHYERAGEIQKEVKELEAKLSEASSNDECPSSDISSHNDPPLQ